MTQPSAPSVSESALQIARDLILDLLQSSRRGLGVIDAHIYAGVVQANIDAATATAEGQIAFGGLDAPPPDALRRKVSISRLSQSLDLPFETVRRRLKVLIDEGRIEMQSGGAVVTAAYLLSEESRQAVLAVDALTARAHGQLQAIGFFEAHPLPSPAARPLEHPARAVARLVTDYSLRLSPIVREVTGDYTNSLLLFQLWRLGDADGGPANASQVARALGVPLETARRRLARLARLPGNGVVARGEGRYAADLNEIADADALLAANDMNLARLYRSCAQIGALEGWRAAALAPRHA